MKKKPTGDKPTQRQAPKATKNDDKLEVYLSRARDAFIAAQYDRALNWALKALALEPGHTGIRALALECAGALQDITTIVSILGEMYRDGTLEAREDFLVVGRMAMLQEDYQLAEAVFQSLLDDAASEAPRLKGRLNKAMLKEAKQTILLAQIMAEEPHRGSLVPAGGPPPTVLKVKPVKTARAASVETPAQAAPARQKPEASTGVASPQSRKKAPSPAATPRRRAAPKPPAEKETAARKKARAANGPAAGIAAPVQPQATPAPPEPLPELRVVFETDPAPVLEAIRSQRRSEPEAVQLALRPIGCLSGPLTTSSSAFPPSWTCAPCGTRKTPPARS